MKEQINEQDPSACVLIVDDNENNRNVLSRRLQKRGLQTMDAVNGQAALEMLAQQAFDLILLDIMMPIMNGYQVLETISQHPEWRHIPVIVISGVDDFNSIIKCIELGAEDYLLKPFNSTLLNARINASLEKKRLRDKEKVYLLQIQEYNTILEKRIAEHQYELKMARRVQTSLLPKETPLFEGWDFAVRWFPAREIAGDYYDFIPLNENQLCLVVGDVTDKGLPASLFMVFARNCIRSSISRYKEPHAQITQANHLICTESSQGLYITLFLCQLNQESGEISYVNAGHEQPFLFSQKSASFQQIPLGGMALGLEMDTGFQQNQLTLESGDFLCIFTDGVPDALNATQQPFGLERLRQTLLACHSESAPQIMSHIEQALHDYVGDEEWYDDITILIAKKK